MKINRCLRFVIIIAIILIFSIACNLPAFSGADQVTQTPISVNPTITGHTIQPPDSTLSEAAEVNTKTPAPTFIMDAYFLDNSVSQMRRSMSGDVLAVSSSGLHEWDGDQWQSIYGSDATQILGEDGDGRLWILLQQDKQAAAFLDSTWTVYDEKSGWTALPPAEYLSPGVGDGLATDPFGNVWWATGRDELRHFIARSGKWEILTGGELGFEPPSEADYQGHFISDVILTSRGELMVSDCVGMGEGLEGRGIRRLSGDQWVDIPEVSEECVLDMEMDSRGVVWAGTWDAVLRYDPRQNAWQRIPLPAVQRRQLVNDIHVDPDGVPWLDVAVAGGASLMGSRAIYHLEGDQWTLDFQSEGWFEGNLSLSPNGEGWLCVDSVLYHLAGGEVQKIGKLEMPYCYVQADGFKRVWLYNPDVQNGVWFYTIGAGL